MVIFVPVRRITFQLAALPTHLTKEELENFIKEIMPVIANYTLEV